MNHLARIPLEDGGCVLIEASSATDGPVKADRISEAIHDLPQDLQGALEPVTRAARATLEQLRKAGPHEIAVEFGVDLAVEAGAVITKTGENAHLRVTVTGKGSESPSPDGEQGLD
ncbi:CU044_2847 family protein [Streptomyces sp. NPDC001076]